MRFLLFIFFFVGSFVATNAQGELTGSDLEAFKEETRIKLNNFTRYIKKISNKELDTGEDKSLRNGFIERAVGLFMRDSKIEVSSTGGSVNAYPIRTYLQRLRDIKYDQVELDFLSTSSGYAYIADLVESEDENGELIYTTTGTIVQCFKGITDGEVQYKDCTTKSIEVVLKKMITPDGVAWVVFLGDINVEETVPN